jgi:hypothetical protein
MAIIVKGNDGLETEIDGNGDTDYRVTYKSRTNAPPSVITEQAVQVAVVAATGLDIGSPWINDLFALCDSIKTRCVRRVDTQPPQWEYATEYHFTSKTEDQKDGQKPDKEKDKTLRPLTVHMSVEKYDAAATVDVFGLPVNNSAGDPITRTRKKSRTIFRYSRYMKRWSWLWCNEAKGWTGWDLIPPFQNVVSPDYEIGFMYCTNVNSWNPAGPYTSLLGHVNADPYTARIEDIRAELIQEGKVPCVKVDIEVHIDTDQFIDTFLDQGFNAFATTNAIAEVNFMANPYSPFDPGTLDPRGMAQLPAAANPSRSLRTMRDKNGAPVQQPRLLDGQGNELAANAIPHYRSFNYYPWRNWDLPPLSDYFS